MGLTIHYSISLPRHTTTENVQAKVNALRQRCLDLPFKEVGEIISLSAKNGDKMSWRDLGDERGAKWDLLFGTKGRAQWDALLNASSAPDTLKQDENGSMIKEVPAEIAIGFAAWPGDGCEGSDISIGLLPAEISAPIYRGADKTLPLEVGGNWQGRRACKTQYANSPDCGGLPNFLRCHLCVIAMLDAAKEIGFDVDVSDEGGYWENRDVKALVEKIGQWDQMLAAMFGAMKDAAKSTGIKSVSAMDGRSDFEKLEHEGMKVFGEQVAKLIGATKAKPFNYPGTGDKIAE